MPDAPAIIFGFHGKRDIAQAARYGAFPPARLTLDTFAALPESPLRGYAIPETVWRSCRSFRGHRVWLIGRIEHNGREFQPMRWYLPVIRVPAGRHVVAA